MFREHRVRSEATEREKNSGLRETRQLATINDASGLYSTQWKDEQGNMHDISLNPEFAGLVAEITGQAISSVSKRLEHPRMIAFRFERSPESCIYTKEFLDANTTNTGVTYRQND